MFQSEGMPILLGRCFWLVMHARNPEKTAEDSLKAKWRKKMSLLFFFKSPWKNESAMHSFNQLQKNEELH